MSVLPLLVVLAMVGAVALGAAITRPAAPTLETTVAAARRHASRSARAAVALGVAAALLVAATSDTLSGNLGVVVLQTPLVYAGVHTVVLVIGELTWPRPGGEVRRARLVRRRPLDAAPPLQLRLGAAGLAVAVLVVTLGALLAGPDGRSFTYRTGSGVGSTAQISSPFPGWAYGGPAAVGLLVLLVLAGVALGVVASRPAVVTRDDRIESALRRASAHRVLRAVVGALLFDTGGLLFIAGTAMPDRAPGWIHVLAGVLVAGGLAMVLTGVVVACLRAPDVPAGSPAAAVS